MHVHMLIMNKSEMILELKDNITALPNDTIKTRGIGRLSLRSIASYKFRCGKSPSCKSISCEMCIINVLFKWTIGRPTLRK